MHAQPGDTLVIQGFRTGQPPRHRLMQDVVRGTAGHPMTPTGELRGAVRLTNTPFGPVDFPCGHCVVGRMLLGSGPLAPDTAR